MKVGNAREAAKRLMAAEGYFDLGMWEEAEEELAGIGEVYLLTRDVLFLRAMIFQKRQMWEEMTGVGRKMVELYPQEDNGWVQWAYAVRRFRCIEEAREILLEGEKVCGEAGIFHFNLACYACQLGEMEESKERLRQAIAVEKAFRAMAEEDSDLVPLWEKFGSDAV